MNVYFRRLAYSMPLNVTKPETSNRTDASNSVSFQSEQDMETPNMLFQKDEVVHVVDFDSIKGSCTDSRRSNLNKMNRISEEKLDDKKRLSTSSYGDECI